MVQAHIKAGDDCSSDDGLVAKDADLHTDSIEIAYSYEASICRGYDAAAVRKYPTKLHIRAAIWCECLGNQQVSIESSVE